MQPSEKIRYLFFYFAPILRASHYENRGFSRLGLSASPQSQSAFALVVALSKIRNYNEESDASLMAQFVSSHPGTEERIEHIEQVLEKGITTKRSQKSNETLVAEPSGDHIKSQPLAHNQGEKDFVRHMRSL